MNKKRFKFFLIVFVVFGSKQAAGQNLIYVDKQGVIKWTKDQKEASFFGVNYTVPFAYGYRSHKALGKDIKQAIDEDVYHMSRLGLDAFRVHMWDVEITDSLGNLLQNEHLDLFDYLLSKLEQRHIYVLITPIAFWGNGYPERDEKTNGFSSVYGKDQSVVKDVAIKAQENYLKQLMNHVNPYTKKNYRDEQNIIAVEINNEPHHSGPKEKTTEYVNRLAAAIRETGWTKPVFYNISESPWYADAVAKSNVEGHSFQWYPSGLVAGHEQKGNFLPNVDKYTIPFDSVAEYRNKARMVYEFDAADIMQPIMYPAMARSFRSAGFQWCTQFAYDPLATAYGNTEYQTHYVNLAYTPAKAISLMIASKVFHTLPRLKSYGNYPNDSVFGNFRVSYREQLSEMKTSNEFYYTGSTNTPIPDLKTLEHIAGIGSSVAVQYEGNGAYFLDKISDGIWRLEVMPDAVQLKDPFERASPKKELSRIVNALNSMIISGDILSKGFRVFPLQNSDANSFREPATDERSFRVTPGIYILHNRDKRIDNIRFALGEFVSVQPFSKEVAVYHLPFAEVSANKNLKLEANIVGADSASSIILEFRSNPRWKNYPFTKIATGKYEVEIPAEALNPGIITYRIIIQKQNEWISFPGNIKGNPFAWDNISTYTYQTIVADEKSGLEIFNANNDRGNIIQYSTDWRNNTLAIVPSNIASQLSVKMLAKTLNNTPMMAWQSYVGDKLEGRATELDSFRTLVVKAKSDHFAFAKITLIDADGFAFSSNFVAGDKWDNIRMRLDDLKLDSMLLLPRPYPGFLPLNFKAEGDKKFRLKDIEKIQVQLIGRPKEYGDKETDFDVSSIWFEK